MSKGLPPTSTPVRAASRRAVAIVILGALGLARPIQRQLSMLKADHFLYATITETLCPATASFQEWQTHQLLGIQAALARAARS